MDCPAPFTNSPQSDPPNCEDAFRNIVEDCTNAVDASLAVFLSGEDPTGPHKARVALRRLTTCLDTFKPILRRSVARDLRAKTKRLFRLLGHVRDHDVYVSGRSGEPGHEQRLRQNSRLREDVRRKLRRIKAVAIAPLIAASVQPEGHAYKSKAAALALRKESLPSFAVRALDEAWESCVAYGPSVARMPLDDLHDFRKAVKSLRYVSEFFADLFPDLAAEPFHGNFRSIQDALGTLNDYQVAHRIERRQMPAELPRKQAAALDAADRLWCEISGMPRAWRQ